MLPIVFCLIPTIVGAATLVGLNATGKKGALLFGAFMGDPIRLTSTDFRAHSATYIIGTFGSALSSIYAYNASNTSGHTKKVRKAACE